MGCEVLGVEPQDFMYARQLFDQHESHAQPKKTHSPKDRQPLSCRQNLKHKATQESLNISYSYFGMPTWSSGREVATWSVSSLCNCLPAVPSCKSHPVDCTGVGGCGWI